MKTLLLVLLLIAAPVMADEKPCADCPPNKPCEYTVKLECNTGYGSAYCIDDKWYGGITRVTTAYCGPPQIHNPFSYDGGIPSDAFRNYSTGEKLLW